MTATSRSIYAAHCAALGHRHHFRDVLAEHMVVLPFALRVLHDHVYADQQLLLLVVLPFELRVLRD